MTSTGTTLRRLNKKKAFMVIQTEGKGRVPSRASRSFCGRLLRHMAAEPGNKLVKAELVCLVEGGDKNVGLLRVRRESRTVDREKGICAGESIALAAVSKRMVLRDTLPESGGFFDQVGVISRLRPVEGGFQQPMIPNALRTTIAFDLVGMHRQHLGHSKVVRHSASFL